MKNILNYTIYYNGLLELYELNFRAYKFYTRLTLADRKNIALFYRKGYTYSEIGVKIGKDKSTICREIKRNSIPWSSYTQKHVTRYKYRAGKAHMFAQKRPTLKTIYNWYHSRKIILICLKISDNYYKINYSNNRRFYEKRIRYKI